MPEADAVLVEIPSDVHRLLDEDPAAALAWRMNSRAIFEEYLDNRRMVVEEFLSDISDGKRRSFYMLRKP